MKLPRADPRGGHRGHGPPDPIEQNEKVYDIIGERFTPKKMRGNATKLLKFFFLAECMKLILFHCSYFSEYDYNIFIFF